MSRHETAPSRFDQLRMSRAATRIVAFSPFACECKKCSRAVVLSLPCRHLSGREAIFCPRKGAQKKGAEQSRGVQEKGEERGFAEAYPVGCPHLGMVTRDASERRQRRQSPHGTLRYFKVPTGRAPASRALQSPYGAGACLFQSLSKSLRGMRLPFPGNFKVPTGQAPAFSRAF